MMDVAQLTMMEDGMDAPSEVSITASADGKGRLSHLDSTKGKMVT